MSPALPPNPERTVAHLGRQVDIKVLRAGVKY